MHAQRHYLGITLIELMIAMAIVGIIAAIAYPNFVQYVHQVRRADAMAHLLTLQMAEEEYRLRNSSYAKLAALGGAIASDYYTFSAANISAETYTLTATAKGGQANDTGCTAISIDHNDQKTPAACWQR